jgi:hypothetical protein
VLILSRWFRLTSTFLVLVLLSNSLAFAAKKPADPAVIKAKIQSRGVGQGVRVTLTGGTDAKGVIVAIHDQGFALKLKTVDQPREIEYAQITGVHNDKLTRGQKVGIVVGAVAVGIVIVAGVLTYDFDHSKF